MIVDRPGYVTERILLLGSRQSCIYLLKGENEYALLGGGMVIIVPEVLAQLEAFRIDAARIRRLFILHSHFDHCGIVPFFKKRWPQAAVTASARAKELLATPKVVASIAALNRMLIESAGLEEAAVKLELDFPGIAVESVVADGDVVSCGGLSLRIIAVPGHSSCSVAVYVEQEEALFASDAGGIPTGDWIFPAANSNFDLYQESLRKMAAYDIDVYLAEHNGALTGPEARHFLQRSMAFAAETRNLLEASYARTGDAAQSSAEITEFLMSKFSADLLLKEIIAMVVGQMFNYIARQAEAAGGPQ